jgi:kynurenine 3-monooxygenase
LRVKYNDFSCVDFYRYSESRDTQNNNKYSCCRKNIMHLLILGASGASGLEILKLAIERGYQTTVLCREPSKLGALKPTRVVVGDIRDAGLLEQAFDTPVDVVVSALGIYQTKPLLTLAEITEQIIQSMHKFGVKRLLVLSSLGANESAGQGSWLVRMMQRFPLRHTLADKNLQEQHIMRSQVEWTIFRPAQLVNGTTTGGCRYWMGGQPSGRICWRVGRIDLAALVLDVLLPNQNNFVGKVLHVAGANK